MQLFSRLKQPAPGADKKEQELAERLQSLNSKAQQRQAELLGLNSTKPVTISSVRVLNATHTRRGFLEKIFNPILSHNQDGPYTLQEALREIGGSVDRLNRFGALSLVQA